jgi:hypothetical protein
MHLASINDSISSNSRTPLMRERARSKLGLRLVADNGPSLCSHEREEPKTSVVDPIALEAARLTETIRSQRRRAETTDSPDRFYVHASWSSDDVLYRALATLNKEGIKLGSMTVAGDQWRVYLVCEPVEDTRSYYDMLPCDV